jgi:hypothetical protein
MCSRSSRLQKNQKNGHSAILSNTLSAAEVESAAGTVEPSQRAKDGQRAKDAVGAARRPGYPVVVVEILTLGRRNDRTPMKLKAAGGCKACRNEATVNTVGLHWSVEVESTSSSCFDDPFPGRNDLTGAINDLESATGPCLMRRLSRRFRKRVASASGGNRGERSGGCLRLPAEATGGRRCELRQGGEAVESKAEDKKLSPTHAVGHI